MLSQSLQYIMNDMAQGRTIFVAHAPAAPQQITELEGFAHFDLILASLIKEYQSAKANRLKLSKENGVDDAMVQMAIDMEDSAWCAMQTRYLELRDDTLLMARVQKMVYEAQLACEAHEVGKLERDLQRDKKQLAERVRAYVLFLNKVKEQNKVPQILEWLILFLIFKVNITGARPEEYSLKHAI